MNAFYRKVSKKKLKVVCSVTDFDEIWYELYPI